MGLKRFWARSLGFLGECPGGHPRPVLRQPALQGLLAWAGPQVPLDGFETGLVGFPPNCSRKRPWEVARVA
eukprot:11063806-Alexandrium_andersonii.AAC.1